MKTLLTITILFFTLPCFSQSLKYSQVENATSKPQGKFLSYESKSGEVFKVGDKLTIGQPSNQMFFNHILVGTASGEVGKADASWAGKNFQIKKIYVDGGKNIGFTVKFKWENLVSALTIDIDNAIETGEVIAKIMTSDQALSELKKAKDKLDLGIISQTEYDSIKANLTPIIK